MIVLIHVLIAISSLVYTTYAFLSPSEAKLKISYGFVGATIGSGTLLVVSMPGHLLSACVTGLTYLGIMLAGIVGVHHRLSAERVRVRNKD
jgi:hypothetical protein